MVCNGFCLIGNPTWKGKPIITILNENKGTTNSTNNMKETLFKSVLVNWEGKIYNAKGNGRDCTDNFVVKYWRRIYPRGYKMTELLDKSDRQYTLNGLHTNASYAVQVIAREDKGAIGVDYNRSPTIYFKTGDGSKIQDIEETVSQEKLDNEEIRVNNGISDETTEYKNNREKKMLYFCDQIQNRTASDLYEPNLSELENANVTGRYNLMTKNGNNASIIAPLIKTLSLRLHSIQNLLYLLACT